MFPLADLQLNKIFKNKKKRNLALISQSVIFCCNLIILNRQKVSLNDLHCYLLAILAYSTAEQKDAEV